jgi:antitoxin (DNA-binding transcriptional repressor) of toxin-antitoxin stability system
MRAYPWLKAPVGHCPACPCAASILIAEDSVQALDLKNKLAVPDAGAGGNLLAALYNDILLSRYCHAEDTMLFLTTSAMRDPKAWNKIGQGRAMVTRGGKPIAIVIPVSESGFEAAIEESSRIEGMQALSRLQEQARTHGLDTMTDGDIQAEIKAARKDRKARRARRS